MTAAGDSLRIAFRADGDERIGAGHVARCLPLAHAFSLLGHQTMFVGSHEGLAARLLAEAGLQSVRPDPHAPAGVSLAHSDAAVVDSYEISTKEICRLASSLPIATLAEANLCQEHGVLVDYHLDRLGDSATERLLPGPTYAPVDRRFATHRQTRETVSRVLVTAGGGSAGEEMLEPATAAALAVFPHAEILSTSACGAQGGRVTALTRASPLWKVTADVDLAVCAAGMTAYELACAGVPAVLVAIAENQARVSRAFEAAGAALTVERPEPGFGERIRACLDKLVEVDRRSKMARRGMELIDGHGAERAAAALDARWRQSRWRQ